MTQSLLQQEIASQPDVAAAFLDRTRPRLDELRMAMGAGETVGRGLNLSTACETALKVTELTGVLVAPYSPADLLHGPVAAVGPEVPALLVAPREPASSSVLDIVAELRRRGAPVMVVCLTDQPLVDGVSLLGLPPKATLAEWLTPLVAAIPGQLVAHALAELRGVDVDRPGGLSKVTLTT